jgi:integrase
MSERTYRKTKYAGVYWRGSKEGGSYCFKIKSAPREDGTVGPLWRSGFRTAKAAHEARVEVQDRLAKRSYVAPSKLTLDEYLRAKWLPATEHRVREATFKSYQGIVDAHLAPGLGSSLLSALTPEQLNAFYAGLLKVGRKDGAGLSPKTVRNVHVVLRKALSDAVRWGLLSRNVAEHADPPRLREAGSTKLQTWDGSQLRTFLDHVRGERLYAAYLLAASTGMRRGEVLGLRWQDVDLDGAQLSVRQTLISIDYRLTFGTPKTGKGRRVIALDVATVAAVRSWKRVQLEERLALGEGYQDAGLVFALEDGSPVHPVLFSQAFDRAVAVAGVPKIRLHDLRHTHATLALQAGVHPKVVSERLGHSTVAFTMDVYSHAIPAMQADAADLIARAVWGER